MERKYYHIPTLPRRDNCRNRLTLERRAGGAD